MMNSIRKKRANEIDDNDFDYASKHDNRLGHK